MGWAWGIVAKYSDQAASPASFNAQRALALLAVAHVCRREYGMVRPSRGRDEEIDKE